MTLIELLVAYRDDVRKHGRKQAEMFLHESCEPALWEHIIASVSDEGRFIDAEGYDFHDEAST